MTLHHFIDAELRIPLDKKRVMSMSTRPGLSYMYYDDLRQGATLKSMGLTGKGPARGKLILFVKHNSQARIGHFCLLFRHPRSGVHFFDPYGLGLRKVLEVTHSSKLLEALLRGHDVHVNRHAFQQLTDGQRAINTCGRHCITRWNACHLTPREYESLMHHRALSADEIVTIMTIERDLKNA